MNVMYLTAEGFDTPNAINHLMMTMIDDFLINEVGVYFVSSHKMGVDPDIPELLLHRNGFTFDVVKRPVIDKTRFVKRYLEEVQFAFKAMHTWKRHKREVDIVLLQSNPTSIFYVLLLKLILRKPIIYNVYDIFPGHAFDVGVIKNKLIYTILRMVQKVVYRLCDKTVVISNDMQNILINEGVEKDKICVIDLWFDTHIFKCIPAEENRIVNKFNLRENKFYVQYAGSLGYVLDYMMIINVAEILKDKEDIVFLIIGDGNQKQELLAKKEEKGLTNIWYYPWQPLELIADVYNACDVGFVPLKKGVIGNGVPSKSWQLMACKKPVLNSVEDSHYHRLFNENKLGISVTNDKPETVADAVFYMYTHKDELKIMGENAYKYVYENNTRELSTSKFIELFNAIIGDY